MELGLTWPLQRLLRTSAPYGAGLDALWCWDAHCITLRGRSALLLVHCASRYTCVRLDPDWSDLDGLVLEEIRLGLEEAGADAAAYLTELGRVSRTRTHGRREVAFLNRAWDDVLAADWLTDESAFHQTLLCAAVNERPCHCAAFYPETGTAHDFLLWCLKGEKA